MADPSSEITAVNFFETHVEVSYYLREPPGIRDEEGTITVSYDSVTLLPHISDNTGLAKIHIPAIGKTIAFRIYANQTGHQVEYLIAGPFLVVPAGQP